MIYELEQIFVLWIYKERLVVTNPTFPTCTSWFEFREAPLRGKVSRITIVTEASLKLDIFKKLTEKQNLQSRIWEILFCQFTQQNPDCFYIVLHSTTSLLFTCNSLLMLIHCTKICFHYLLFICLTLSLTQHYVLILCA